MSAWIEQELEDADFGDKRLHDRLCKVVKRMWESPQKSITGASVGWNEITAAYRFFDNENVTAEQILAVHQSRVLERTKCSRLVLHIQDTTELDYSTQTKLQGAGPLNEQNRKGFFAHSEYVLQPDGLPLGLWHSNIYARDPAGHGLAQSRKSLPIEQKESYRWLQGYQRACELKKLNPRVLVISISDREGDIYEIFEHYLARRKMGQPVADWIIRSNQNRCLENQGPSDDSEFFKLHERVQQAPLLGTMSVAIRAKVQFKKVEGNRQRTVRSARMAELEIRATEVELKAPARVGHKLQPLTIQVLMAKEMNPPPGEDPIEWILLTNLQVKTYKRALRLIRFYCQRWQIEVFHKILKSGCQVEKAQLKTTDRLLPRIALQMIIAWRIHYLSLLGRVCPDLPCSTVFDCSEWKAVVVVLRGKGAEKTEPTLSKMIEYIALLGGHPGRKNDGPPGPKTIWQGLQRMFDFATLWRAWA